MHYGAPTSLPPSALHPRLVVPTQQWGPLSTFHVQMANGFQANQLPSKRAHSATRTMNDEHEDNKGAAAAGDDDNDGDNGDDAMTVLMLMRIR